MEKSVKIGDFLSDIGLGKYTPAFQEYGVDYMEDVLMLVPEDWEKLKNVLPFHRKKIVSTACHNVTQWKKEEESKLKSIHSYTFTASSAAYHANHKVSNLNDFEPQGYGMTNTGDDWMKFTFDSEVDIYGVIIGANSGVSGGWSNSYLEGVAVQVGSGSDWKTVHTIQGMPNAAKTAYLAKIDQKKVREVRFWKKGYFSTSFIHFV